MEGNSQRRHPCKLDRKASNLGSGRDNMPETSVFPITTFTVGNWKRESTHEGNLNAVFFYTSKKVEWDFNDGSLNSKMRVSWSDITAIEAVMNPNQPGILRIQLAQPPLFFQEIPPPPRLHPNWKEANDFTNGQALIYLTHEATFPPGALDEHYEKLLIKDERLAELSRKPFPPVESVSSAPSNAVIGNHINNNEPTFVDSSGLNRALVVPDQQLHHYNDRSVNNEAAVDDSDVVINALGIVPSPPPPLADFSPASYQPKWKPEWSVQFKWANPVYPNGLLRIKCHVCCLNDKRGSNPFANDGAKSVGKKSLLAHESTKLHIESNDLFADEVLANLSTSLVPFDGPASAIPTAPLARGKQNNSTLNHSLLKGFTWAFVRCNTEGEERLLCKVCVSFADKSELSSFANLNQGSATFTKRSLEYHATSDGHLEAVKNSLASSNAVVMGNQINNEPTLVDSSGQNLLYNDMAVNNEPAFVGGSASEAQNLEQNCETVDEEALAEALGREADAVCDDDRWSMIEDYMKQTDQEDHGNELVGGGNVNEASSSASSPPSKP